MTHITLNAHDGAEIGSCNAGTGTFTKHLTTNHPEIGRNEE